MRGQLEETDFFTVTARYIEILTQYFRPTSRFFVDRATVKVYGANGAIEKYTIDTVPQL
ncbi:MAG: hypothetical protein HC789_10420 [Microcoleus sp. CSU_2_2]|nr:hypothetical protein [Microcoleus sp. CSU_2_2]